MLCCCFAVRGADDAAVAAQAGKLLQLSLNRDQQQQQQEAMGDQPAAAAVAAAAAATGCEPSSRNSRSSTSSIKAAEPLIVPRTGGLTLLVGDASGCVHFIDCL
jgi:hypothetical protein